MELDKISLFVSIMLSIIALSLSTTGWIICCISFFSKVYNYSGEGIVLVSQKAFLFIFFGSITFSLSDICVGRWMAFFIQLGISCLNLCIYIIHSKTYREKLEYEKR